MGGQIFVSPCYMVTYFPPGAKGTPPPCSTPARYFGSRTMSTYVLQFFSYKCFLSIFIYNIALQNADFGVLRKSSKHFLISIFFPPGERGTTPPCPFSFHLGRGGQPLPVPPARYNFVVKNVFVNIYIQHSLTKLGFVSSSEVI